MRTIYIDCAGVKSVADFWQRYVDATQPTDAKLFGRNLDAFWDAIEAAGPGYPGEAKLIFRHSSALASLPLANGASLLAGLRGVATKATRTSIELA